MKTRKRRIRTSLIIIGLASIMIFTLLGTFGAVAADNDTVAAGGYLDAGTYQVTGNFNLNKTIRVRENQTVTITGSGTMTCASNADVGHDTSMFSNYGTLIIEGSGSGLTINANTTAMDNSMLINNHGTVILRNVTVKNVGVITAGGHSDHGGVIKSENGDVATSVTLDNVTFQDCYSGEGGGIYLGDQSPSHTLTINNSKFINCIAVHNSSNVHGGGAICIKPTKNKSTIKITNTDFTGCWSGFMINETNITTKFLKGGAILVRHPSATDGNVAGANASFGAGAEVVLDFENLDFTNCYAHGGGGIQISSDAKVTMTLDGTNTFTNCYAKLPVNTNYSGAGGGAISFDNGNTESTYNISGTTFKECYAPQGGAIYYGTNSKKYVSTIDNCNFQECYTTAPTQFHGGGAISIRPAATNASLVSSVEISGSTFTGCSSNSSSKGVGGAILVRPYTNTVFKEGNTEYTVAQETASNIGAPLKLTIKGTTISTSVAKSGGGIYLGGSQKLTFLLQNSTIDGCTSNTPNNLYGGGGIAVENTNKDSTFTIDKSTIKNCVAQFDGNVTAGGNGGGIRINEFVHTAADLIIKDSYFYKNSARNGSALMITGPGNATITVDRTIFDDNFCTLPTRADSYGGTIRSGQDGRFRATFSDCLFRRNISNFAGGVFYWNQTQEPLKPSDSIYLNTWKNAINAESVLQNLQQQDHFLDIIDCHFYDNWTRGYTAVSQMGGALFFEAVNTTVEGTAMPPDRSTYGNLAGKPGSISAAGLDGTLIEGNVSDTGGGIGYKSVGSTPNVMLGGLEIKSNVVIRNNLARHYGGGFSFRIIQTQAYNAANAPSNIGNGAVFTMIINGAILENNTAVKGGGAIYMDKIMDNRWNTTCTGNLEIKGNTIIRNNTSIYNQNADGAININNFGTGTTNMSYVTNEKLGAGGAIYLNDNNFIMESGTITGNIAATEGGAIYISGASATIKDGTMSNNKAMASCGGAISIDTGHVTVESGDITNNWSKTTGGAIDVAGGNVVIGVEPCKKDLQLDHEHPNLKNNTAQTYGGGVSAKNGTITMYCGEVFNNSAEHHESDNIYFTGTGSFTIWNGNLGLGKYVDTSAGGIFVDKRAVFNIIYYPNHSGITGITMNQTFNTGWQVVPGIPANQATEYYQRKGYTFYGWAVDNPNGTAATALKAGADYHFVRAEWTDNDPNTDIILDFHFYAVWIPDSAYVTISATAPSENYDYDRHAFVLYIKSTNLEAFDAATDMKITIKAGETQKIYLPVGTYSIESKYGWRYAPVKATFTLEEKDQQVTLNVSSGNILAGKDKWLNTHK